MRGRLVAAVSHACPLGRPPSEGCALGFAPDRPPRGAAASRARPPRGGARWLVPARPPARWLAHALRGAAASRTDFPVLCDSANPKVRLGPTSHAFLKKSPVQQRGFEWRRSSRLAKRGNLCKDVSQRVWSRPLKPAALVAEGRGPCPLPPKPDTLVAEDCDLCPPGVLHRELQGCSSRNAWACAVGGARGGSELGWKRRRRNASRRFA